jgi:CubicO group peptidase (beta-lactamase class C family)
MSVIFTGHGRTRKTHPGIFVALFILLSCAPAAPAEDENISKKLEGFDQYMEKILQDWNAPGVAVGVVAKNKLVFAKGYGYRDYGQKLPMTPDTMFQMASNTKLFTAVAVGLLVEEGRLEWDKPIRQYVPAVQFYNDELNKAVTIRDMLAHRTGVTRHDMIWYKSDFTRKELFERLKYLEPEEPLRQSLLYNNLMYAASGYIVELLTQKTWENFLRERIFGPLGMTGVVFSIEDMKKQPAYSVPYKEKRDSTELMLMPHYEDQAGIGPAGSIISNVQEMSHWLIALMSDGKYQEKQVIPSRVLKATLEPAIAPTNSLLEDRGYQELLNPVYGTGRYSASYRGHYLTYHGGAIGGCYSQVSSMPYDQVGVIVLVIGGHCGSLPNVITYNLYERLLGLAETPWSARYLDIYHRSKVAGKEARAKAGADRAANTKPSHALADYVGEYEHPAYGILKIGRKDNELQFDFHKIQLPLSHYHYDRFDTPNDELWGKWSVNFGTNPQGDVDKAVMSLDEDEVAFTRRPTALDPKLAQQLIGTYETPTGVKFQVVGKDDGGLFLVFSGQSPEKLIAYKGLQFRIQRFSDFIFEFVVDKGQVTALKQKSPTGEYTFPRK